MAVLSVQDRLTPAGEADALAESFVGAAGVA